MEEQYIYLWGELWHTFQRFIMAKVHVSKILCSSWPPDFVVNILTKQEKDIFNLTYLSKNAEIPTKDMGLVQCIPQMIPHQSDLDQSKPTNAPNFYLPSFFGKTFLRHIAHMKLNFHWFYFSFS